MCVQRILGRDVYSEREKIAWSIVVANKGPQGFIDELVNSDEYLDKFGYDTIPYQQRRILPQRVGGDTPFNLKTPRYAEYHRSQLPANHLADKCPPFCSSRAAAQSWRSVELFGYGAQYAPACYSAAARGSG